MFIPSVVAASDKAPETITSYQLLAGGAANTGYTRNSYGVLTPDVPYRGFVIRRIITRTEVNRLTFTLDSLNVPNEDDVFAEMRISGTFTTGQLSLSFLRADAEYNPDASGRTEWDWDDNPNNMINGNEYLVEFFSTVTEPPPPFTSDYPLTATSRISNPNFGQDDPFSAADREAIGKMDSCLLHGFFAGNMDPPVDPNYLARPDVSKEILAAHPTNQHYLTTYFNMMEKSDNGDALAIKIGSEVGPNGTDWWCRDANGNQYSFFEGSFGVNLSTYVTADAQGLKYAEWYADNFIQPEYVDVHVAAGVQIGGPGGVNCMLDNFQLHSNKSGCDWDQDGRSDGTRLHYDAEIPEHVANDPTAVTAYTSWRTQHMAGLQRIRTNNPGIFVLPNTNQWANSSVIIGNEPDDNQVPSNINNLRNVILEYRLDDDPLQADVQGGFSEKNINDDFPTSGVNQFGVNNRTGGSWDIMYNKAYQSVRFAQDPQIIYATGAVNCLQGSNPGAGGRAVWPSTPASNAVWHLFRWLFCTTQIAGAHCVVSGRQVSDGSSGRAASTPLFDEYGVINEGATGLSYKWMGKALENPPSVPHATHSTGKIYIREFENALCIVNTDNDENNSPATVVVANLPGGANEWMRFDGSQDSSQNDGTYADSNFQLDPIDGIVLVRRSWYEPGTPSIALYSVTAGEVASNIGFSTVLGIGSLSPDQPYDGNVIETLMYTSTGDFWYEIDGSNVPDDDSTFTSLTVNTQSGDVIFNRADASYQQSGGNSRWVWPASGNWISGNSYSVTIAYQP